jgi:uncharacterized membrane protein
LLLSHLLQAVLAYVNRMQYNAGDITLNTVIRTFWETIVKYHVLPRCELLLLLLLASALVLGHQP